MGRKPKPKIKTICMNCAKEIFNHESEIRKGGGKFCSMSCRTTYYNIHNNPSKNPEVRKKISQNHADVSGKNNPMYGVRGINAPSYIDGRSKYKGDVYRKKALANKKHECELCGETKSRLDTHHIDGDRKNNELENLILVCRKCHLTILHNYERDELGRFTGSNLKEVV